MGIDCRLLWTSSRKRMLPLRDERFYVGMLHGANTSPKNTAGGLWRRCAPEALEADIGEDLAFYRDAFGGTLAAAGGRR